MKKIYLEKNLLLEFHTEDLDNMLVTEIGGDENSIIEYLTHDTSTWEAGSIINIDYFIQCLEKLKESGSKYVEIDSDSLDEDGYILFGYDIKHASPERIKELETRRKNSKLLVLKVEKQRAQELLDRVDQEIEELKNQIKE